MRIKDLPVDYGEKFNARLAYFAFISKESPEEKLRLFVDDVLHQCLNCEYTSKVHFDRKCPFDSSKFESILQEAPGPLVMQYLLKYFENPEDPQNTWKQEYMGKFPSGTVTGRLSSKHPGLSNLPKSGK